jgi:hypothetical protein
MGSDRHNSRIKHWKRQAALNGAWLLTAILLMTGIEMVWPYKTWAWGVILGIGAGGSAVFLVAAGVRAFNFGGFGEGERYEA